ncbi:MAG TPA: DUF2946 family protein [Phenylobacterium sp.]|jgi:hypothetical protein|nr:DUF2946 family protein [Phenylobacterium sp.]
MGRVSRTRIDSTATRPLGLALLLVMALAFRALVPAGWMPNIEGVGGAPLVICTGTGSEVIHLGPGHAPANPHVADRHDVCSFAGVAAAPPGPAVALAEPSSFVRDLRLADAPQAAPPSSPRHREQAPRAPPEQA